MHTGVCLFYKYFKRPVVLVAYVVVGASYIHALNLKFYFLHQSRASLVKGRAQANAVAQQALIAHWQSIVKCIDNYLKITRANQVSGASKYSEMGVNVFALYMANSLQYCDNTGPSIPSLQIICSDIFFHKCSVILQVKVSLKVSRILQLTLIIY